MNAVAPSISIPVNQMNKSTSSRRSRRSSTIFAFPSGSVHASKHLSLHLLTKTLSARTFQSLETEKHWINPSVSIWSKIFSPTCGMLRLITFSILNTEANFELLSYLFIHHRVTRWVLSNSVKNANFFAITWRSKIRIVFVTPRTPRCLSQFAPDASRINKYAKSLFKYGAGK